MKKLTKTLLAVAAVAAVSASVAALGGCSSTATGETGEAYALTHSDGQYVSKATVTVRGDDITEATLTEVYTPVKFTSASADGDYTVDDNGTYYFKTIKYGSVTLTYSADESDYMIGSVTMTEYFKTESHAKEYFDAVTSDSVTVVLSTGNVTYIICNETANKDNNGYWTREDSNGNEYSRWQANRDATLAYVVKYDAAAFGTLTKSDTAVTDSYGVDTYYWYDANSISTGASWSDMYITDTTRAATGYIQLLQNAYNAAK